MVELGLWNFLKENIILRLSLILMSEPILGQCHDIGFEWVWMFKNQDYAKLE